MAILQQFAFSFTIADTATTGTYTIGSGAEAALTDVNKTFYTWGMTSTSSDPTNNTVTLKLTNTTTLTATRSGTSGAVTIKGYMIEGSGTTLAVDHISFGSFSNETEVTNALSNVTDISKAWIIPSGRRTDTIAAGGNTLSARLFNDGSNKVGIISGKGLGGTEYLTAAEVQVVQYENCFVQRGTLSDITGTSTTQAISAVTLAKSFPNVMYRTAYDNSTFPDDIGIYVKFDSTTQISVTRTASDKGSLVSGQYEIVSFTDGTTVQEVLESFAAATTSGTNTLTTLTASGAQAFVIAGANSFGFFGQGDYSVSDIYGEMCFTAEITSATNCTITRGTSNGTLVASAYVVDLIPTSAPTATVPDDGICVNTYGETAVPGIVVTAGSSSIVSVATTATSGFTLTYNTTGTSVTVSGNGTNAATLLNGASTEEYTTVLDTLTVRGTTPNTDCTITVIPTDGTLNDNEQFTVMCDPASITVTGTNANVIDAIGTLKIRLIQGQTHDTISVSVVDDTAGTPLEADSSFLIALEVFLQDNDGALSVVASTRGITDVIM